MMQAPSIGTEPVTKPYLAEEVSLGIDSSQLSVTLMGERHQFDSEADMEQFLCALWEQGAARAS